MLKSGLLKGAVVQQQRYLIERNLCIFELDVLNCTSRLCFILPFTRRDNQLLIISTKFIITFFDYLMKSL